jgi:exoribonuclease-2
LDLVMHQQLRAFLNGEPWLDEQALMERVGAVESMTGSARQAERLSNKHWTLVFLLQHPDWQGQGVLVDRQRGRGTILIPELDLVTYLHLREDLPLNSELSLKLVDVNLPELEAFFRVED